MAGRDDLEARVVALETQVRELSDQVRHNQRDAAAARVLAGGADRDVTEIREEIRASRQATTSGFNAMREDLADIREETHNGFAEMRGKLDGTTAGLAQVAELLTTLIGRDNQNKD